MEMFANKMLVSFTAIVVVFTSDISYNHAEELPKVSLFNTPGSSDISGLSLGDTYATTKFSRDPWNGGYMPFATPDFTKKFSPSKAQQRPSEVEDPVLKPVGLGLNGWGRIPRVPKFSHQASPHLRLPPLQPPSEVEDPVFKPVGLGLNGWGRIPRVPKSSHRGSPQLRLPPIRPPRLQQQKDCSPCVPLPPIQAPPTFEPLSPTPTTEPSPFKTPTSVTEPPSLDQAIPLQVVNRKSSSTLFSSP